MGRGSGGPVPQKNLRLEYMRIVKEVAESLGLAFQTCREGFPELGTQGYSCDGSSLAKLRGGFKL